MSSSSQSQLRIAQVSPLWECVPPSGYGGVEMIVSLLSEHLVQKGHQVTLFATGDSKTTAKLEVMAPEALRKSVNSYDYPSYELQMLRKVFERQDEFDLIHFHDRFNSFFFAHQMGTPTVHTLHYALDPEFHGFYEQYTDLNFIHISQAQRAKMPSLPSLQLVYNGINLSNYPFSPTSKQPDYLAFLGRMSKTKGPHLAIQIAKEVGLPLKMAGKVDEENLEFFEMQIQPLIDGKHIQFLGEVTHQEKVELLGGAIATLFPIQWNEPFGLVMIESMACGTPLIGMNRASVPEIVAAGKTGFICDTIEDFAGAVAKLPQINRQDCRQWVEQKFSAEAMVNDYEKAYCKVLQQR